MIDWSFSGEGYRRERKSSCVSVTVSLCMGTSASYILAVGTDSVHVYSTSSQGCLCLSYNVGFSVYSQRITVLWDCRAQERREREREGGRERERERV